LACPSDSTATQPIGHSYISGSATDQQQSYVFNYNIGRPATSAPGVGGAVAAIPAVANTITIGEFPASETPRCISGGDLGFVMGNYQNGGGALRFYKGLTRHLDGTNYTFADGHVKWLRPERISTSDTPDGSGLNAWFAPMRDK